MILHTTIEWPSDDTGAERGLEVRFTYHRAIRGQRDSLGGVRGAGPPLEPDEPAMVEVDKALMDDPTFHDRTAKTDIWDDLSKAEQERIEAQCLELAGDDTREYERD
jgi:hypothetical protein